MRLMNKMFNRAVALMPLSLTLLTFVACSSHFNSQISKTLSDGKNGRASFSVSNGKLYDAKGAEFIIRGVNTPHAYYKERSDASLQDIASYGFNTVRIVWCAGPVSNDIPVVGGRCEEKDMHSIDSLKDTLDIVKDLNMVAVLNLQNATGSNDVQFLGNLAEWFVRDEVKEVLNAHKSHLILNIANEWHGQWITSPESTQVSNETALQSYVGAYKNAIKTIRNAGLEHVLIIDGAGYAQDFDSIPLVASELLQLDKNLMFSAHLYDVFKNPESVNHVFETVRNKQIPFLIGEFACSHGYGKSVDCETIVKQADGNAAGLQKYGYIAWSYFGNSSDLSDLDIVDGQGIPKQGWGEFITQAVSAGN
jgi:mannan endo-1,4-beta-mannosidase